MDLVKLSQQILTGARTHKPVKALISLLAGTGEPLLVNQLAGDDNKKAFWINLYNAYTQLLLQEDLDRFMRRNDFFSSKQISIAGRQVSLDDIEHGILRRSKVKWAFGYMDKWFPSAFERRQRVDRLDYRIHFALNCGARSCPPIAFYDAADINRQLDVAMESFLTAETEFDARRNLVLLPVILSWYRSDFGGTKNILALLKRLALIPEEGDPSMLYKKYNWQLFLENYK